MGGMESTVDRENKWLSIQDAAQELGVNPRTIRRYIRLGRLDVSRLSNKVVRIRLADLDRLMETGVANKAAPEPHAPAARPAVRPAQPARFSPTTPGSFS